MDPHIPLERVEESALVLHRLGAAVTKRVYRGMAHTVHPGELDWIAGLLDRVTP